MEIPERVWSRVEERGPDECWPLRTGTKAQFQVDGERYILRRVLWEKAHGKSLASGTVVTTSCEVGKGCHNPAHLVAIPRSKVRAGWAKSHTETTHCPQGHPYDEENTHIDPRGRRRCRQCNTDRLRAKRRREKQARLG